MTNADKIRSMTDEELAIVIEEGVTDVPWCRPSTDDVDPVTKECKLWSCLNCALSWLKSEAPE